MARPGLGATGCLGLLLLVSACGRDTGGAVVGGDAGSVSDTDAIPGTDVASDLDTGPDAISDAGPAAAADADIGTVSDPDAGTDTASHKDTGSDTGPSPASLLPAGLGASPCQVNGELPTLKGIDLVPWFTGVTLQAPIDLTHPGDGSDRVVVVERAGRIKIFSNSKVGGPALTLLDLSKSVSTAGEGGLLSIAFHPKFASNGHFFVNYTAAGPFRTVVARYTVPSGAQVADPSSAQVLLEVAQPFSNHDGGMIAFDGHGQLLIGMGDGGSGGDPLGHGQNPKTLLGAMLRIDVDAAGAGKTYGIPADNPNIAGWLPEIFAIGLRNPWRFSLDPPTGRVWIGDVGQNKWEEVDLLAGGANYGWNQIEGTHCYKSGCNLAGTELPVFEYSHSLGNSITGGRVYRGKANKSLYGAYVFGDYGSGRFWATRDKSGQWSTEQVALKPSIKPVAFGADRDGELYVTQLWGQAIHRVVEVTDAPPAGQALPAKLSQTGCFSGTNAMQPAKGVLPFAVNAPLWSDGAHKLRFLVPPPASPGVQKPAMLTAPGDDRAAWDLPVGTLLIKHFGLGPDPHKSTPVETRFMRRDANHWRFFTYAWNAAGTEAELVLAGKQQAHDVPGGKKQNWTVPSIAQCQTCHGGAKGTTPLGVRSDQLDGPVTLSGQTVQQLGLWAEGGLLGSGFKGAGKHQPLSDPTSAGALGLPLEQRARTYLAVQCASCHRPGAAGQASMDLRLNATLAASQTCAATPQHGDMGVAGAKIVAPGQPDKSVLHLRMVAPPGTEAFMPALGVNVPDVAGVALLKAWIAGLKGCP